MILDFLWFWLANFDWIIWHETILPNVVGTPVHKSYLKKKQTKQKQNKQTNKQPEKTKHKKG